jgi:hypothetical protein
MEHYNRSHSHIDIRLVIGGLWPDGHANSDSDAYSNFDSVASWRDARAYAYS